ncbi:hypothetical protein Q7P37_007504 [Cladosporium fusiforme]
MPPKRSKKSEGSSQPLPSPQKPVRTSGRKRRASDASSVQSEQPAGSQSSAVTGGGPAKKRKTKKSKVAVSEEPETIIEEEETVTTEAPQAITYPNLEAASELEATTGADDYNETEFTHTESRHVHFGSDDIHEKSTATHKTPHSKMAIKRRVTESPTAAARAANPKRYRTITHRTSLPSLLSQEHLEPVQTVQENRFASLREVLDERIRRRMRRSQAGEVSPELDDLDRTYSSQKEVEILRTETAAKEARINELILELESQRQLGIDANYDSKAEQEKLRSVEVELEVLRKQILHNRARGHLYDLPDDNMMVIDSQEEVTLARQQRVPETPTGAGKRSTLSVSRGDLQLSTPGHRQWEDERRRFQDSILALSKEANEATTNLQILNIELKSLGFSQGDDVEGLSVVQSIRESFDSIRERLDLILPGTLPENASNEEILDVLIANVQEFAEQLRISDREKQEQVSLSIDLRIQVDKLIDHLASSEIRVQQLKQQWRELDEGSERKEREIEDLEADLDAAEAEKEVTETALKAANTQVKNFEADIANLHQSTQRLTASLVGYRDESERLTNLITKMEGDHITLIAKMNAEREATVGDLETRLDAETALRDETEKLSAAQQVTITGLDARILAIETERDTLITQLQQAQADLQAEHIVREQAETDAATKDTEVNDLETRVTKLETELDTISAELEELRDMNEAERRQREAAETDLDDRNVEIEELNKKLHERGTEANGLRQKLFEVQQQNGEKVKNLETAAADREAQYQQDIAQEVDRREDAEEVIRTRDATILELTTSLAETEERMAALLALRDARIEELEQEVAEKNHQIGLLQDDLRSVEEQLSTQTTENQEHREELEASILSLQTTINNYEITIQTLQRDATTSTDLHNSEMEDRNSTIASLNHNIVVLKNQVSALETEKVGLEDRVTAEAEAMLRMSAEKEDEIDSLKQTIRDKQSKILIVEEKAVEADRRWQEVLDARDDELNSMRAQAQSSSATFEEVSMQRDSLKQQFQAYIRRSAGVIDSLQAALERARATAEKEGDAFKGEGGDLLAELEGMDEITEMVSARKSVVQQSSSSQQSSGSRKSAGKGGKKKRVYDSGFGVASDEVDGEMA